MRIGIVSTPEHCKAHLRRLSREGYRVECLGGSPSSIPPSIDAVVLRTESCSHGASDTAFKWKREGHGPLIVENGLSGILRNLQELLPCPTPSRSRGGPVTDPRRAWPDTLPDRELPDVGWSRTHTLSRLTVAYSEARAALEEISETSLEAFKASYDLGKLPTLRTEGPTWAADFFHGKVSWAESKFRGKPRTFAMFLLMLLEKPTPKTMGSDAYQKLTGKLLDIRVFDACAWYLSPVVPISYGETGRPQAGPPEADPVVPLLQPVNVEPEAEAVPNGGDTVESNTEAILTLMEEVAELRKGMSRETPKALDTVVDALDARIKALEEGNGPVGSEWEARIEGQIKALDERVTQVRLDQIPDSGIESRIKALELGASETLRQAQTSARQAVEAMGEELRSDISNAFDALAAEKPSGDVSSNPFAALEQVKAALKAAGFTGTLTLTIE